MPKHGKKFRNAAQNIEREQRYPVLDAVQLALSAAYAKFDETVDVAVCLGVNPKYSDQMVRGSVSLPHGLGKDVRVAVFCKGEKQEEAKQAGADVVGAEDLIEKIQSGWLEFDKAVASPDMMAQVGKIGRVLGPRGLMPNAKIGTVTFDVGTAVKELKAGKVDFKVDKAGVLHAPIGKVSFGKDKLADNLRVLIDSIIRHKPSSAKGTYLRAMALSTTMGPGVKVDATTIRSLVE
jgi:large subunit ribosomal protein L1